MSDEHLREAGLKVTLPRVKVFSLFEQVKPRHLSAEDVYQQLKAMGEEVGLATVYRVLTQFESSGLLKKHHFEGGNAVYELDEGAHHDHLVCVRCGAVEEFVDEVIEARQEAVAETAGFVMTDHTLTIYGTCAKCSATRES